MEKQPVTNIGYKYTLNLYLQKIIQSFKELHGNPHYLALGIGIGVFVGMTPTFPLHTIIAIPLAHIFRGSKRAALLGVWISNPLTLPFCYYISYKVGMLTLDKPSPFKSLKLISFSDFLNLGLEVGGAMMLGGLILGVILGLLTYMITYHVARVTGQSQ
jgi:uncharacterized protein (DUF2062 family)